MKKHISPFQFSNYRDFVRAALKENGFSYQSFADRHREIVSRITLASTLSRGRSGTKNKPTRNFSPETLARIGKALKLSDDEISALVLLKFENDSDAYPGLYGSAYLDCIRRLIRDHKSRPNQSTNKQGIARSNYTQTADTVAQLLDALSAPSKLRLAKEILLESKAVLARQRRKAGVKTITSVIDRLEELTTLGAP